MHHFLRTPIVVGATFMAPVVHLVNVTDMVNRHDGRHECGPYDVPRRLKIGKKKGAIG